jgi:alpha-ketoglutarate-dependent taurine dioxygenase
LQADNGAQADPFFPTVISNASNLHSLSDVMVWANERISEFQRMLDETGALLFRGFPIKTSQEFDQFVQAFGYEPFTYEESFSNAVRINLTPRVFTANEAPSSVEIFLHHEMAQTPVYPSKIFFCCLSAAETGGATPLCRSDALWAALKEKNPEWMSLFVDKGLRYWSHMPANDDAQSGQGRSWKSTLSVGSVEEAEARLRSLGYTWEWQTDQSLIAETPRLPAVKTLNDGSQSFFNQLIAAHRGWRKLGQSKQPVVTLGDRTIIPEKVMEQIIEVSEDFAVAADWRDGDVLLLDNHRVMHGRYPYSGQRKRQVIVSLGK